MKKKGTKVASQFKHTSLYKFLHAYLTTNHRQPHTKRYRVWRISLHTLQQPSTNERSSNCALCSSRRKPNWNNVHLQQNREHEPWQSLPTSNIPERSEIRVKMHGSPTTNMSTSSQWWGLPYQMQWPPFHPWLEQSWISLSTWKNLAKHPNPTLKELQEQ